MVVSTQRNERKYGFHLCTLAVVSPAFVYVCCVLYCVCYVRGVRGVMPWLRAPIFLSEVLSEVADVTEV